VTLVRTMRLPWVAETFFCYDGVIIHEVKLMTDSLEEVSKGGEYFRNQHQFYINKSVLSFKFVYSNHSFEGLMGSHVKACQ
jgi:hypothetical protein